MKRGRPSKYTETLADRICEHLSTGETLRQVCRRAGMPDISTVLAWEKTKEDFSQQYARARESGYRAMAEEILEIADDGTNDYVERERADGTKHVVFDGEHVQRSKLRVDTRKWLLSKALPKLYGDKLEVGGKDGQPLIDNRTIIIDGSQLEPEQREMLRLTLQQTRDEEAA